MDKEILEVVKKRINNFEKKYNITTEFSYTIVKSRNKAFAICGNQDELECHWDEIHNMFIDLKIYCCFVFMQETYKGYKSIMFCYELNNKD